eukprot:9476248-Pyramimonas_sp.AAC.1
MAADLFAVCSAWDDAPQERRQKRIWKEIETARIRLKHAGTDATLATLALKNGLIIVTDDDLIPAV